MLKSPFSLSVCVLKELWLIVVGVLGLYSRTGVTAAAVSAVVWFVFKTF